MLRCCFLVPRAKWPRPTVPPLHATAQATRQDLDNRLLCIHFLQVAHRGRTSSPISETSQRPGRFTSADEELKRPRTSRRARRDHPAVRAAVRPFGLAAREARTQGLAIGAISALGSNVTAGMSLR